MVYINQNILIIASNINGLNTTIKRQKQSKCIKQDSTTCCLKKTHCKYTDAYIFKNKWIKKDIPC